MPSRHALHVFDRERDCSESVTARSLYALVDSPNALHGDFSHENTGLGPVLPLRAIITIYIRHTCPATIRRQHSCGAAHATVPHTSLSSTQTHVYRDAAGIAVRTGNTFAKAFDTRRCSIAVEGVPPQIGFRT